MVGKAQRILQARQLIRMLITCLENDDPGPLTDVSGHRWEMPEALSAYSVSAYLDCTQCLYIVSCLSGISATSQEAHLGLYLVALDWTMRNVHGIEAKSVCFISIIDGSIKTVSYPLADEIVENTQRPYQIQNYDANSDADIAELLAVLGGETVEAQTRLGRLAKLVVRQS